MWALCGQIDCIGLGYFSTGLSENPVAPTYSRAQHYLLFGQFLLMSVICWGCPRRPPHNSRRAAHASGICGRCGQPIDLASWLGSPRTFEVRLIVRTPYRRNRSRHYP